jgi:hypothetical protein
MSEQRAFPICGCRYCPAARLRRPIPVCDWEGDAVEVLPLPLVDGEFPDFCPLPRMPEGGP